MAEEPSKPLPDELRVVMDVEIHLQNRGLAADQPKLQSQLLALSGVESVNFTEQSVSIRYDPEEVTRSQLCAAITNAGFQVAASEGASATPAIEPTDDEAMG